MAGKAHRFLVWAAGVLAAGAAVAAFSSERWLAERADDSDMLRLRAAFAECAKKVVAPAENVSMVLESYPDGTAKSRITAARAMIFSDSSYIWAEKIRLEQFDATGTNRTARLDAENCLRSRRYVPKAERSTLGDSLRNETSFVYSNLRSLRGNRWRC